MPRQLLDVVGARLLLDPAARPLLAAMEALGSPWLFGTDDPATTAASPSTPPFDLLDHPAQGDLMEIRGTVALVTGAAAGAGRAIADGLAAAGARVVAADLAPGDGDLHLDVTDDAALVAAIEQARPDVLVNNAGGGGHVPPHYPDASLAEWSGWLDLNLRAPMLATQVALRCGAGAVVNVASMAGVGAEPHVSPEYAAAKAGLIRFTTALADPRVSCLVPGWIRTERAEAQLAAMTPDERATAPHPITLDDITTAVLQLIAGPARVQVLP